MLKDFQKLINELQAENSSNGKKEILKKYPQCKDLLKWTLDPYKKFGVTSDQLKKHSEIRHNFERDGGLPFSIKDLLWELSERVVTGHDAIGEINSFIENHKEYKDLIYRIIDKDLKCRTGATLINKVYPGLIPEFNVALAKDYFKEKNVFFTDDEWTWSRKLDGVRCICRIENGDVKFFSREGHEFLVLDNLKALLIRLNLKNCVLDGEICITDANGAENFQDVMKEIRKKDHTIKKPKYLVFDYLTLEEFDSQSSTLTLSERLERIPHNLKVTTNTLAIVEQHEIDCEQDLYHYLDFAEEQGWEGLILRKDVPYEGKRTKNMLKVKKMKDAEYKVVYMEPGKIDDGQGNKVDGMSAVVVMHKGNPVKVGSGWTFEERIKYYHEPWKIIGKTITVKYFEETKNQNGTYSLRFPIMKAIHGEKREV
jgi:DNA ligase-1